MSPVISSTAKLKNVTGSIELRNKQAETLRAGFSKMLDDTFESKEKRGQNPTISFEELKQFYKNIIPNITVNIKKAAGNFVMFNYGNKGEMIKGYDIGLKGKDDFIKKGDYKALSALEHESAHLINYVTQPKIAAKKAAEGLSKVIYSMQNDFYDGIIYANEIEDLPANLKKTLQLDVNERVKYVKGLMNDFFGAFAFDRNEKIDILQSWRYSLKDELVAYKQDAQSAIKNKYPLDELSKKLKAGENLSFVEQNDAPLDDIEYSSQKFVSVEQKIDELKEFIKKSEDSLFNWYNKEHFFLEEKIKLVEDMLVKEITNARVQLKNEKLN